MNEVLTRRFEEYLAHKDEGEGFGRLPDLILLDGGAGQVSAVRPVLDRFGIDVPLFGMVKDDKHRTRAITGESGEIAINMNRRVFSFVTNIQDEVHRFAIGYHRNRRSASLKSSLTDIEGIGEKRAAELLRYFKTIKNIKEADLEELMGAPRMTRQAAMAVYRYFHPQDDKQ